LGRLDENKGIESRKHSMRWQKSLCSDNGTRTRRIRLNASKGLKDGHRKDKKGGRFLARDPWSGVVGQKKRFRHPGPGGSLFSGGYVKGKFGWFSMVIRKRVSRAGKLKETPNRIMPSRNKKKGHLAGDRVVGKKARGTFE